VSVMLGGLDKSPGGEVEYRPFRFVEQRQWRWVDIIAERWTSARIDRRGRLLTTEVPRLEILREAWLDDAEPELHERPPGSIMDHEESRPPDM
jgi:hypothetical protein